MDLKKFLFLAILSFSIIVTSSFVSSSVLSDYDYPYEILPDVSPLLIEPPVGSVQYRWNNGVLQANYGTSGRWDDVTSPVELLYMLNQLGVASLSDVPTQSDYVEALKTYFGLVSFPVTRNVHYSGVTEARTYSNLAFLLADMLSTLSYNQIGVSGYYLTSEGNFQYFVNPNAATILSYGIDGLAYFLGSGNNETPYSYLSSSGSVVDGHLVSYLAAIPIGFAGLSNNIKSNISDLGNDIFLHNGTLSASGLFPVGYPGEDSGVPRSNLALYLGDYLSAIQRPLITQNDYLYSDGLVFHNRELNNKGLADITSMGFQGLATLLRGTDGIPLNRRYNSIDYKTNTVHTDNLDNIFDLLLYPLTDIQNDLALYLYSHGTDLDIKERENMQPQAEQFVDDFTDPDGKGTPSVSNVSDAANVSGGIRDSFQSDSTVADIFTQISDDGNFGFFSSRTQSELNPMYNSRSYDNSFIDFLSPHLSEIDSKVGSLW